MPGRMSLRRALIGTLLLLGACSGVSERQRSTDFRIATFRADITPPLGHALCGGMVAPAARIGAPLSARGILLWGGGDPILIAALDWTELRNDAYRRWREALAQAAGTTPSRVLLSCVHQHDAPYADLDAQRLLDAQGLKGLHVDPAFHEQAVLNVAAAVREAAGKPRRITHLGVGRADVDRVASNRRVVSSDGRVTFKRYSKTTDPAIKDAPEGQIDPALRTLSFWDGETAVAAISSYAVHPMSHYGAGSVSADFPGLARSLRERELPDVLQVYVSGCSGDVTAAKYNAADEASRKELAERLRDAMARAWTDTRRGPIEKIALRVSQVRFELPPTGPYSTAEQEKTLTDPKAATSRRLMAALGLSWARRVGRGEPIEVPALDFGPAQYLLLPAEAFVEFQLAAQRSRPDQVIVVAGYGECAPGYIPTEAARGEGYVEEHGYTWVADGAEEKLRRAITEALGGR
jgi:hypothetical protein